MVQKAPGICTALQSKGSRRLGWSRSMLALACLVTLECVPTVRADVLADKASASATSDPTATPMVADDSASRHTNWALYGQFTNIYQWHPAFASPYSGANSLSANNNGEQTNDVTLYAGYRLSPDTEIWINPEYDQGYGLNNTLGVAGFPSGEAYKVGANNPYYRTPRLFVRRVFNLGGEAQQIDAQANQMSGTRSANNVVLTLGKFAVPDVFDTNTYAHDPRSDFLNWSIVESGAFDYAADAWGYSYGASAEWTQDWWTLRGGVFDLSVVPNTEKLSENLSQLEAVIELEERHQWHGSPGKFKVLVFDNHGNMGRYSDAVRLAAQTGNAPNTGLVRRFADRPGIALNLEQALAADVGLFARASMNDGREESFDFTDINQSFAAGLSVQGERWGRAQDTVGAAWVANGLSSDAKAYFAAGGMSILIGDGQLPHYASEEIMEIYYAWHAYEHVTLTGDYQHIANPAYNMDRGPVDVFAIRLHFDY